MVSRYNSMVSQKNLMVSRYNLMDCRYDLVQRCRIFYFQQKGWKTCNQFSIWLEVHLNQKCFLTSPTPHMWSLTSLLRYRFWRRVNIPVSIQEGFSLWFWRGFKCHVESLWFGHFCLNKTKKKLYFQSLARFQSCCMSCHVATLEVLVCHNMTTYLLIASWLALCLGWSWRPSELSSFLLLKKHASIFMCAMVKSFLWWS